MYHLIQTHPLIVLAALVLLVVLILARVAVRRRPQPVGRYRPGVLDPERRKITFRDWCLVAAILLAFGLSCGCSIYKAATGVNTTTATSTAESQTFTDLYNAVYSGATASAADLTGDNGQNGADTVQAAWIAAGENAGATLAGQLLTDYGGTAVSGLASTVTAQLNSGKFNTPALLTAALQTVASAIQNVVYSGASPAPTTALFRYWPTERPLYVPRDFEVRRRMVLHLVS